MTTDNRELVERLRNLDAQVENIYYHWADGHSELARKQMEFVKDAAREAADALERQQLPKGLAEKVRTCLAEQDASGPFPGPQWPIVLLREVLASIDGEEG